MNKLAARIVTAVPVLFLAFDVVIHIAGGKMVEDASVQLDIQKINWLYLGLLELMFLVLYVVPRTAIFGAVLWTGYLGGAIAVHLRLGNPWFSHTLFPVYVAVFLWLGVYLRDADFRAYLGRKPGDGGGSR